MDTGSRIQPTRIWSCSRNRRSRIGDFTRLVAFCGSSCQRALSIPTRSKQPARESLRPQRSALGFIEFAHPVAAFQQLAGARAVGWSDDSIFLHQVDKVSSATVADAQA